MTRAVVTSTLTTNTSTSEVTINESGYYAYAAIGTFGSGTLTPYITPLNQSAAVAISDLAYTTSKGDALLWLSQGDKFYATLTGATSPSIAVTLTWAM